MAVRLCEPGVNVLVTNVATLGLPAITELVPSVVTPSLNVTVPVGPAPVIVAVIVTGLPEIPGLAEDDKAVVDAFGLTTWVNTEDVLAALFASPAYTTVILWLDTLNTELENVAIRVFPAPDRVPVPSVLAPSLNVTAPVGAAPVTLAVRVIAVPDVEGFRLDTTVAVVAATLIVCDNVVDVLVVLAASPAYTAVIE